MACAWELDIPCWLLDIPLVVFLLKQRHPFTAGCFGFRFVWQLPSRDDGDYFGRS